MPKFNIQKKDFFILSFLVVLIILVTFVWTNHYYWLKKQAYIFEIPFIKNTIICSEDSPVFMYEIMDKSVVSQKSMSNQLAYLDPMGDFYHCESGWVDGYKGNILINPDSRFRYASVSKVLTSAMIIHLVNEGKLSLDEKLINIIDIPVPQDKRIAQITVSMLLQHSAGFDRMKTYTPMLTMGKKPWCPTHLDYLSKETLDFDPNTQFQYSNVGYCLLGAIVEKKTGLSFRAAVEKQYFLHKRNIKFVDNDFLSDEIKYDYRFEDFYGEFWRKEFDFKDSLSAVGGLSGSAKQMVLLTKELLKDKPLNILSRSTQPCSINLSEGCYGFAFEPYQKKGSDFTIYNKSGYFPGVEADLFVDEKGGILMIIRGATTPNRQTLAEFRNNIYEFLKDYYKH